jgi:1-hydroxycarotenoid 3,4-desaturase
MHRLAQTLAQLAEQRGADLRYETEVSEIIVSGGRADGVKLASGEQLSAAALIVNADVAALAAGHLGTAVRGAVAPVPPSSRSLSALTWNMIARSEGFPLLRHNVFFSGNYSAEFDDIFKRSQLPQAPTVYICAQDRDDRTSGSEPGPPERLLCLVNAPARGDSHRFSGSEIAQCEQHAFSLLEHCGLYLARKDGATRITTPNDFEQLFPATGGALYGQAAHGWKASFSRPGARSRIPALYLAGGSTNPGPGVPMAALSGRLASRAVQEDLGKSVNRR